MQGHRHKLHFLLHAADLVEERLRIKLAPLGIGPRQARILNALHRLGRSSQIDLARAFDVSAASMSTMTARLIAGGLISRTPDPAELRSNVLVLTDSGRAKLLDIHQAWRAVDRIIDGAIGPEKADALAALTHELRDALGGRVPGGSPSRRKQAVVPTDERP